MRNKLLTLLVLIVSISSVYSQEYVDIKNQKIDFESFDEENMYPFLSKVYTFIGDDFDSLDLEILLNGPILGSLIVGLAAKEDNVTYDHLYQKFLEIKQTPQYAEVRTKQLISSTLMNRPADINNWEDDKPLFINLGFEGDLLEKIQLYIEENSSSILTYETVLVGFREQLDKENEEEREVKKSELKQLFESSIQFDETEALSKSKDENKPILLYFTGYNCVNCRKIEHAVLYDLEVSESIIQNFIFKPIYVDDRNELPKEEQIEVNLGERTRELKTIGDKHTYYQMSRFNVSGQPYFVVLNSDNEIIGTADYYDNTINKFLTFLNESLAETTK
jgi:thioredoxin-related protein